MISLSTLKSSPGSTADRKRVGRGPGSGKGKTSGRGNKGQKSRSGYKSKAWKEGGQMPLQRRLPKRGFTNIFKVEYQEVAISKLAALSVEEITPEVLYSRRVIRKKSIPVKILGDGEISKAVTVKAHAFSNSAREKIEKAGGRIEIIMKKPAEEKRKDESPDTGRS